MRIRVTPILLAALITCGCGSERNVRPAPVAPDPKTVALRQLSQGNFAIAAKNLEQLVAQPETEAEADLLALAALAYRQDQQHDSADRVLLSLETAGFAADTSAAVGVASMCAMHDRGEHSDARQTASGINPAQLHAYASLRYFYCFGASALALGEHATAAQNLTEMYRVGNAVQLDANAPELTWSAISQLPESTLVAQSEQSSGSGRGWYELGLVARRHLADPAQFSSAFAEWRAKHASHPGIALESRLNSLAASMAAKPRNVALILPFGSDFAGAATAVRDGFMTARYLDASVSDRPEVRIYDSDNGDFETTVRQAVADGADILVGPLRKPRVSGVRGYSDLGARVLALNIVSEDNNASPAGFYQFGLSPEDEANQVARRAIAVGKRALLLVPDTSWGHRMHAAYSSTWSDLGGTLVAEIFYGESADTYPTAVKRGFSIDLSETRGTELQRTVGINLHREPRRRQDVDVILLAGFPDNARQILPQIRYFRAENVPVYATSHVYAGGTRLSRDSDLDGITFGDMPWLFAANDHDSFNAVRRNWGAESQTFARLYGFGIDAYRLLPYLPKLQQQRGLRVPGVTGDLWMDERGVIHRNMTWLQFVDGLPQLQEQTGPIRVD